MGFLIKRLRDFKTEDLGRDIVILAKHGINTKTDRMHHYMHHKFATFDQTKLLTGSFNWTRNVSLYSHENIIATDNPDTLSAFKQELETLWGQFSAIKV